VPVVAAIAALAVPGTSAAQEVELPEPQIEFEFSFSNPGARSMGLGGAFVALADDATAAFANPAGLVQLLRPEVSLELRRRDYETPYTAGGRALGSPTGYGIDTVDGIRTEDSKQTTSGMSYLSFVYPGRNWSLALYRHQLADFAFRTEVNGLFGDVPEGGTKRPYDQRTSTELDIIGTGLAWALQASEKLSLGLGLSYFTGRVEFEGAFYAVDSFPETFWEANSFLPDRLVATQAFDVEDSCWGFNFGFLWRFAESWRLGGVYRQGPRFEYEISVRAGPLSGLPAGTVLNSLAGQSIAFPDVWGMGLAYRSPDGSLTVGFEWDLVEYSVIVESLDSPLVDTSPIAYDDANELHLGLEYVFLETSPLFAVRGGLWYEPDHSFEYTGPEAFPRAIYRPGKDALHLSIGAGIAFKNFQIDLGADFSNFANVFAVSGLYSF
jgi:long-subunit fatty acid transport protein